MANKYKASKEQMKAIEKMIALMEKHNHIFIPLLDEPIESLDW